MYKNSCILCFIWWRLLVNEIRVLKKINLNKLNVEYTGKYFNKKNSNGNKARNKLKKFIRFIIFISLSNKGLI